MRVYKPYEPIGHDVPPEIYLGLMLERRNLDFHSVSSIIRSNSLTNDDGSLIIPFHIEEYVSERAREITNELRRGMTKYRKEEIPFSYIEKFLKDSIMAKI